MDLDIGQLHNTESPGLAQHMLTDCRRHCNLLLGNIEIELRRDKNDHLLGDGGALEGHLHGAAFHFGGVSQGNRLPIRHSMRDHAGDPRLPWEVDLDLVQGLLGIEKVLEGMEAVKDTFVHGVEGVVNDRGLDLPFVSLCCASRGCTSFWSVCSCWDLDTTFHTPLHCQSVCARQLQVDVRVVLTLACLPVRVWLHGQLFHVCCTFVK
mmetsp:Transcript_45863/g.107207  ORF Transcript_45863/g.107207 Transcript_45863/m.107207 type:complete len:208 (+) Transcript_45863:960-1583(+)